MGNLFIEESNDVLRLDKRDILDPVIPSSICHVEEIEMKQYKDFVTDSLLGKTTLSEPYFYLTCWHLGY